MSFVIAIDGLSASGKGAIAKKLAARLGFEFLDTGCLYRLVALEAINKRIDYNNDIEGLVEIAKNLKISDVANIRTEQVGNVASIIAVYKEVRDALYNLQRDFPKGKKGAVIEGRDIGTYIFPDANIKFFIVADLEVRAVRRQKDLHANGDQSSVSEVMANLKLRDERDSTREVAPLKPAEDAVILENNESLDEILEVIISYINRI